VRERQFEQCRQLVLFIFGGGSMPVFLHPSGKTLCGRRWDDEDVIFDPYSGETHCLNALASAIFQRVDTSGGLVLRELDRALACPGGTTEDDIAVAVARLHGLGLIRVDHAGD
jgi:PqqD family protein of HPr-rel-A system